ncbi:hypothetical protein FOA52_012896 [Chlamydomonas sp. UWO 241]|nr:hypothetical protein FOA52_012896 [Chlamydomonas sp. UWO 241]
MASSLPPPGGQRRPDLSPSLSTAAGILHPERDDEADGGARLVAREGEVSTSAAAAGQVKFDGPQAFTFYDVFFWRDAPDWYRKTFMSAGFGLCYCVTKQYLNRHELEVFMPPRAKILPASMQKGYRQSQMLKYGFLRVGTELTTITGAALTYYAGAWYAGKWRGVHNWENFAMSGAAAGAGVALWLLRPVKLRPIAFGMLLGGAMGGSGTAALQSAGMPLWDHSHDFEGWFLGSRINLKQEFEPAEPSSSALDATAAADGAPSGSQTGTGGGGGGASGGGAHQAAANAFASAAPAGGGQPALGLAALPLRRDGPGGAEAEAAGGAPGNGMTNNIPTSSATIANIAETASSACDDDSGSPWSRGAQLLGVGRASGGLPASSHTAAAAAAAAASMPPPPSMPHYARPPLQPQPRDGNACSAPAPSPPVFNPFLPPPPRLTGVGPPTDDGCGGLTISALYGPGRSTAAPAALPIQTSASGGGAGFGADGGDSMSALLGGFSRLSAPAVLPIQTSASACGCGGSGSGAGSGACGGSHSALGGFGPPSAPLSIPVSGSGGGGGGGFGADGGSNSTLGGFGPPSAPLSIPTSGAGGGFGAFGGSHSALGGFGPSSAPHTIPISGAGGGFGACGGSSSALGRFGPSSTPHTIPNRVSGSGGGDGFGAVGCDSMSVLLGGFARSSAPAAPPTHASGSGGAAIGAGVGSNIALGGFGWSSDPLPLQTGASAGGGAFGAGGASSSALGGFGWPSVPLPIQTSGSNGGGGSGSGGFGSDNMSALLGGFGRSSAPPAPSHAPVPRPPPTMLHAATAAPAGGFAGAPGAAPVGWGVMQPPFHTPLAFHTPHAFHAPGGSSGGCAPNQQPTATTASSQQRKVVVVPRSSGATPPMQQYVQHKVAHGHQSHAALVHAQAQAQQQAQQAQALQVQQALQQQQQAQAQQQAQQAQAQQAGTRAVSIRLLMTSHGEDVELCTLVLEAPLGWAPTATDVSSAHPLHRLHATTLATPAALHVTHIKRRAAMQPGGVRACAATLAHACSRRHAQLLKMAQLGLVAVASPTKGCSGHLTGQLVLVPFVHPKGQRRLRLARPAAHAFTC